MVGIPECTSVYVLSGTPLAHRPAPAGRSQSLGSCPTKYEPHGFWIRWSGLVLCLLCFDLVPSCLPHTTTEKASVAKLTDSSKRFPLCLYLAPECSPQGVNSMTDVFPPFPWSILVRAVDLQGVLCLFLLSCTTADTHVVVSQCHGRVPGLLPRRPPSEQNCSLRGVGVSSVSAQPFTLRRPHPCYCCVWGQCSSWQLPTWQFPRDKGVWRKIIHLSSGGELWCLQFGSIKGFQALNPSPAPAFHRLWQ